MERTGNQDAAAKIIETVLELLETEGYDAVQLREVARRARVSLTTVYKLYPTRDDLMLAAVEQWLATNTYGMLTEAPEGESLRDGIVRLLRSVFEPWEHHPRMLEAYFQARSGPRGHRLDEQGFDAILPAASALFDDIDPDYVADIGMVLTNMTYALIGRFAAGSLEITEILPALERIVYRLTTNNEPLAAPASAQRPQPGEAPTLVLRPSFISPYDPGPSNTGDTGPL
ncbi:TetR family transcriptional regulator [Nocardia wallacei]|uniref:TetR family transcriptional regulator n=1 Tax=Nocardia wallacei TaxID=480035 RepID=A0A7G1KIT4_9NOCA|nr:TetR family transcriptional regulator [Nocardia wallacei]BCK55105.1 TetR family transcriptional regulator [Nocardia wallacei]